MMAIECDVDNVRPLDDGPKAGGVGAVVVVVYGPEHQFGEAVSVVRCDLGGGLGRRSGRRVSGGGLG